MTTAPLCIRPYRAPTTEIECPACDGRGWIMATDYYKPWKEHRADCEQCDGRGIQEIETEETCDE